MVFVYELIRPQSWQTKRFPSPTKSTIPEVHSFSHHIFLFFSIRLLNFYLPTSQSNVFSDRHVFVDRTGGGTYTDYCNDQDCGTDSDDRCDGTNTSQRGDRDSSDGADMDTSPGGGKDSSYGDFIDCGEKKQDQPPNKRLKHNGYATASTFSSSHLANESKNSM